MANFLNTPISSLFNFDFWKTARQTKIRKFVNNKTTGQLAVDVFQTEDDIIVLAPVAGIKVEDVEVVIQEDVLTIRGMRSLDLDIPQKNYYAQECFWGEFTRSIVLPTAVNTAKIDASFEGGILKIQIPKANKVKMQIIKIKNK
jgi:HSP20 family protein